MQVTTPQTLRHVVTMVAREVCGESPEHRTTLLNEDFDRQVHESLHKKGELIHAEDLFKKQNKK